MELTKERPILMNTESVVGILDDRKTQTRRVPKQQPPEEATFFDYKTDLGYTTSRSHLWAGFYMGPDVGGPVYYKCPFGKIGDRLWVRETWQQFFSEDWKKWPTMLDYYHKKCAWNDECKIFYKANGPEEHPEHGKVNWKPSIHISRIHSRILLEITDIRVERVQDITNEDIQAEGVQIPMKDGLVLIDLTNGVTDYLPDIKGHFHTTAYSIRELLVAHMAQLWDSINAKPKPVIYGKKIVSYISYPWDDIHEVREHRGLKWVICGNCWIWAVTFKVLKKEV